MNEHKKQTKRRKRSQREILFDGFNGIHNNHHNNHRNHHYVEHLSSNYNNHCINHNNNHNHNHSHNHIKKQINNDDEENNINIKDDNDNNDDEDDTPSIRDMQTPINSDIDQESDHIMTENKPLQNTVNDNINTNVNTMNINNNGCNMENKEEKLETEMTATATPKITEKLKEKEEEKEEEKPSSLRVSFINNKEFSSLSYYDRERLSRMKLSLLYIKCCIAVLRPNSPTFPKQNELHRWLDSKNHPPLTRIDIVCTISLQLIFIAIMRL